MFKTLKLLHSMRGDITASKYGNTWILDLDVDVVCPGTQRYVDLAGR
jgi:hypothetical protein